MNTKRMNRMLRSCLLLGFLALAASGGEALGAEKLLAAETAAQAASPSCFPDAERWTYPATAIPAGVLPARDPARTVFFGGTLELTFTGADPKIPYELELTFLSDSNARAVSVTAGGQPLEARLALPFGKPLTRRWAMPPASVRDGRLTAQIRRVAGPNAAVSAVRVFSSAPGARPLQPEQLQSPASLAALAPPRLTARPASVRGAQATSISLGGMWKFSPAPLPEFWTRAADASWKPIQVPGEWVMQGFTVEKGTAAGYLREFTLPADWAGQRVKLRADGVYSDARVWVNGREAGAHLGGFTAFELDVTALVKPGQSNAIALAVRGDSKADALASGSQYATHDLGGIPRKIYLVAVPAVHIASFHVNTTFDPSFTDARLALDFEVVNEGPADLPAAALDLALASPAGLPVGLAPAPLQLGTLKAGATLKKSLGFPVPAPLKWDSDHPNLYRLTATLAAGGQPLETVPCRVGFRQVEVRGNQLFLNGLPVKLRGVCRHEVDPLRGRSLTPDRWRQDVEVFIRENVNFVRTSHYPPAEEFLDAADELGLLVESEAPVCWAGNASAFSPELLLGVTGEMVELNRNHPSVIIWSLANESTWSPRFAQSGQWVRLLDPSRPQIFSNGYPAFPAVDIESWHYPGPGGLAQVAQVNKPWLFDEYCHLNAYNRREQIADPGLRDVWGLGFANMWETMAKSRDCLGGSLWAAIDDTFFPPGGGVVGYGTWGPIDGWRRPKPEYWHVTKVYSPVRVTLDMAKTGQADVAPGLRLQVENRSDFTDLKEMRFEWTLGGTTGRATVQAPPGKTGVLTIPLSAGGQVPMDLELKVIGPRGFMVDAYRFTLGGGKPAAPAPVRPASALALAQTPQSITIRGAGSGNFEYVIDAVTGQLQSAASAGRTLAVAGPVLTLVPLDAEGGGNQMTGAEPAYTPLWGLAGAWKAASVSAAKEGDLVKVKVAGAYAEASGNYELAVDPTGRMTVSWNFTMKNTLNPRQTGVTFTLPAACDTLTWRRQGQWSWYPADHIGRTTGRAKADSGHPLCGLAGPRTAPSWPWSEDQNQYGSNDFRATRFNIFEAALTDAAGLGLRAVAAADRHARAWMDGGRAHLLVADYANDGAEGFHRATRVIPNQRIANGGTVAGTAQVELVAP